ncbi:MAG: inorganic pyrophosphatase [Mycobacterium leprae]
MSQDPARFWTALDELVATHETVIDRPRGSHHPRFPELIYPMDYGYLAGTVGGDGDGVDLWRGSLPEARVVGVIMTVDLRDRDAEYKILIGCTPEEAAVALAVHNRGFQSGLLVMRT